ncbi:hypothetical protein CI102_2163 [Trichoderma harzianum]|nr:hypothetical protein CI102_2163 [Trichoderma harzianum]
MEGRWLVCLSISVRPRRSNGPDDSICFDCVGAEEQGGVTCCLLLLLWLLLFLLMLFIIRGLHHHLCRCVCPSIHHFVHPPIHPSTHLHGKASKHPRRCFSLSVASCLGDERPRDAPKHTIHWCCCKFV